jgi:hypothetical protein
MEISLCQIGDAKGNNIARRIVENYHSYVPSWDSVGRRIDWIIMLDKEIVGVIGIGSATYPPCKDILTRLGVSKEEYKSIFNNIANNWRFCWMKSVPNLGTMVLKRVREIAPYAWKEKYGDDLKYLITFVGGGNNGAVYRADNWEMIGYTSGLPSHESVSMKWDSGEELKQKFVKPTGEDKKMIFFKTLKPIKYEPLTLF